MSTQEERDLAKIDKWASYRPFRGDDLDVAHALLVNAGFTLVDVEVPATEPRGYRPWSIDVRAVQARRLARKMGRR